jgi:hypothetical protein
MCWSKFEREEWMRTRRELEEERLREISASESKVEESEAPEIELDEREGELIRV